MASSDNQSIPPEFSFRTRHHFWVHLKSLRDKTVNVIVIGGGITGAGILRELGLQGIPLSFLFEKNDFASGTSSASSKLIHAGLRYLELAWNALKSFHLIKAFREFRFVLAASRERKILSEIAPQLVKPQPIYFALDKSDGRSRWSVALGIWTYFLMQRIQGQRFPRPSMAFRKSTRARLAPDVDPNAIKAVFSFWDASTDDARLVIETLQSAHALGAYALNYVEVTSMENAGPHVRVDLKNRENGETLTLTTKILINATGAFVDEVRARNKSLNKRTPMVDRVAGSHVDYYPAITDRSYYFTASDNRLVFVLNRHEDGLRYTRVGTTERALQENEPSDFPKPSKSEIEYLNDLVNHFIPSLRSTSPELVHSDAGIRPLKSQAGKSAYDKNRDHAIYQEGSIFHVVGVKLTDFRRVAVDVIKRIPWEKLNLRITDLSRSERIPLRQNGFESDLAYVETNIQEMARRTMIVHWSDYFNRRRGLAPHVLSTVDPTALQAEFKALSTIRGWKEVEAQREWRDSAPN